MSDIAGVAGGPCVTTPPEFSSLKRTGAESGATPGGDMPPAEGGDLSRPASADSKPPGLPVWRKALFMPAAKQMTYLAQSMESVDFWRLRPQPECIAARPREASARRFIAAAGMETKALALVYLPEDLWVDAFLRALPPSPLISWLNRRTGETNPAMAVVSENACQSPTPNPGDWLLLMRAGKRDTP
jgi:hypothetical protein